MSDEPVRPAHDGTGWAPPSGPAPAPEVAPTTPAPARYLRPPFAARPYPASPYPVARRTVAAEPAPVRVDPVPGTGFGVAYYGLPATVSGPAIGSLVSGIASILVSILVFCFGLTGATEGWGALVGGAFAILAALLGSAGAGLGLFGLRQVARPGRRFTGKGLAIAGISCGGTGVLLAVVAILLAWLVSV